MSECGPEQEPVVYLYRPNSEVTLAGPYIVDEQFPPHEASVVVGAGDQWSDDSDATYSETNNESGDGYFGADFARASLTRPTTTGTVIAARVRVRCESVGINPADIGVMLAEAGWGFNQPGGGGDPNMYSSVEPVWAGGPEDIWIDFDLSGTGIDVINIVEQGIQILTVNSFSTLRVYEVEMEITTCEDIAPVEPFTGAWAASLGGVMLSGGGSVTGTGCLSEPPDGMGLPGIRNEDVTFPQRDGVTHYDDWYEPRIVTLADVTVCPDGCPSCPSAKQKMRDITTAWSRKCDDVELVLFTDCYDPNDTEQDRSLVGPFGVVGRPRVADVTWFRGKTGCGQVTLRFDATDHRMFILDQDGTPGSGEECVTLTPSSTLFCRSYPRCYPMCYDNDISTPGAGPVDVFVDGNLCAYPIITLYPALTNPEVENLDTGETIGYTGVIGAGADPVIIDTYYGTATQGGASRTHLLTGTTRFTLPVGASTLRLRSFGSGDNGEATVCWRPSVDSA